MKTIYAISCSSALAITLGTLLACGGGGGGSTPAPVGPTTATKLVYTANPSPGPYQWVQDTGLSQDTHLVLKLVGPSGTSGRGVGFYVNADASKVTWAKVASTDAVMVQNGAFTTAGGPMIINAKTATNGDLQAGVYQRGIGGSALAFGSSVVLARVALDLKTGIAPGSVTFTAPSGKSVIVTDAGAVSPVTISCGTITAQ